MEGVADFALREVLTRIGGYDMAVSEFVRVSGTVLPLKTYERISPELAQQGRTAAGTPVVVQLLGSDPGLMAENAARLALLAPHGVDLNFGCPARVVNRHGGGAMLLDRPELLNRLACAVRAAVPRDIPVSAKMRLGVSDPSQAVECAQALAEGGVAGIVVHARTRDQGYRAPAHWEWVARIASATLRRLSSARRHWRKAAWPVSWCMRAPAIRGIVLRRIGSGWRASMTAWRCRWWPTAKSGVWRTGSVVARSAACRM
jgi:tRNA-dihydrouridine synthase C